MVFQVNEAPDIILNAIRLEKTARLTGYGWNLCLAPFTCFATIIFPEYVPIAYSPPDSEERVNPAGAVKTLKQALQRLKNDPALTSQETRDALISNQVKQTLFLVEAALRNDELQGRYRAAIEVALQEVKKRIAHAESKCQSSVHENTPLLSFVSLLPG